MMESVRKIKRGGGGRTPALGGRLPWGAPSTAETWCICQNNKLGDTYIYIVSGCAIVATVMKSKLQACNVSK